MRVVCLWSSLAVALAVGVPNLAEAQASAACDAPTFGAAVPHELGRSQPSAIATGDLNRDGNLDVVVAGASSSSLGSTLVFPGTSDGVFGPPIVGPGFIGGAMTVADFNRDGNPDLAVMEQNEFGIIGHVWTLLGDGAFGFGVPRRFLAGNTPTAFVVGDFNGDTRLDVVVGVWSPTPATHVLLPGDGAGGFGAAVPLTSGVFVRHLAAGDFNGDARLDLATIGLERTTLTGAIEIRLANATGGFDTPVLFPAGGNYEPTAMALADVNEDDKLDVAMTIGGGVSVFLGDGAGSVGPPSLVSVELPNIVAIADVNGDGHIDLAVAGRHVDGQSGRVVGMVHILEGAGTGDFAPLVGLPIVGDDAWQLATGDFDRNGLSDFAVASHLDMTGFLSVVRNMCGAVVDLSAEIVESHDPALADVELTYTVTVTNHGLDAADVLLSAVAGRREDFGSATASQGTCPEDRSLQWLPNQLVNCYLGRLSATVPGNTATVTIVVTPSVAGSATLSATATTGGTDPDPSSNSAAETTSVQMLGGAHLKLGAAASGGTALRWRGGDAQAGYFIGRLTGETVTVLPADGIPLPPTAGSFVDPAPMTGQFNCYAVGPVDAAATLLGRSDLLCLVPNSASSSGAPSEFTISLEFGSAVLDWAGPGGQSGYALLIYPRNGPRRQQNLLPQFQRAVEPLNGIATCFVLLPASGSTVLGNSDMLCAVPEVRTIPQ